MRGSLIIGGPKVSSKISVTETLLEKVDLLLLGGGIIFTFYSAQGCAVGSSFVEEDKIDLATSLNEKAKANGVSLSLPSDVVIAEKFAADSNSKECVAWSRVGWRTGDVFLDEQRDLGDWSD